MKNFIPHITVSVKPELMAVPMSIIELKVELPYQKPYYLNQRISSVYVNLFNEQLLTSSYLRISNEQLLTSSYLEVLFEHATKEVIQHIKQQMKNRLPT